MESQISGDKTTDMPGESTSLKISGWLESGGSRVLTSTVAFSTLGGSTTYHVCVHAAVGRLDHIARANDAHEGLVVIADMTRFEAAIARFDAANAEDPNQDVFEGMAYPKELLYARRMTAWLEHIEPGASEALRLAARSQHIRRWEIPRHTFPKTRTGYLRWRTTLYTFHADTATEILRQVGYDETTIDRVRSLLRKTRLKHDAEVQCLEDVACLVFLESYFAAFAAQQDEEKLIGIVQKTWHKMSPRGQQMAQTLTLPPQAKRLVEKALATA